MKRWKINRSQRKTALKMARTIFDRLAISTVEASRLLMDCFHLALVDLLDREYVEWLRPPPENLTIEWTGTATRQTQHRKGLRRLRKSPGEKTLEKAYEGCETLFDKYNLDEDERDTLFTALPCLGFMALEDLLEWRKKPPFPEVN